LYGCFREREQKGLVTSYDKKNQFAIRAG
jgi:hypothetical protein